MMTMPGTTDKAPADQAARVHIRQAIDETLFVEAGAGTGKTTALVSRICSLVASGVPISAIAAITFTEAAAAELRDRIRLEIEGKAAEEGDTLGHYSAALAGLDAAAIQTLHGFARRILALYPLEAGLPPRFDVRDSFEAAAAFDDAFAAFVGELFSDTGSGPRLPRALTLGFTTKHLRDLAQALHDNFDRLERIPALESEPCEVGASDIVEALEQAIEMRGLCRDPEDKLLLHLDKMAAVLPELAVLSERVRAATDEVVRTVAEQELLGALNRAGPLKNTYGKKQKWTHGGHSYVEDVRGLLAEAESLRAAMLDEVRRDCIEFVLPCIVDWALHEAEERRREGTLEYHDLLVLAVRLVRNDARVRQALHRRFTHLLIDEFQDTDPLQIELATLLTTTADEVGDRPWEDLPVAPGSLFFVGDPRQSIYRFRRAEIELYEAAGRTFTPRPVHLTANFRSRERIVAWVNGLFENIFKTPYGVDPSTPRQADYTPLVENRSGVAPVERVNGGPVPEARTGEIRAAEAREIAALIRSGRAHDWLRKLRPGKRTRFADMTILIPDRNALPPLERALEAADIPFRVEGSTLLFGTQEVRDLTNILAAIDDPADEVAVIAALRSPAFACGDDELYAYRQLQPRRTWDYTSMPGNETAAGDRVREALETLAGLYRRRSWMSNAELVETIIRERRLFELAFANARPRDAWQRIRFLHEQARRFDDSKSGTLRHFVGWLRESAKSGAYVTESVVPDPDDDAVRIMTIHASKGLEFPIVFVAGLLAEPRSQRKAVLFDRSAGRPRPEVSAGNASGYFRTEGYAALDQRERVMDRLERDRLLYVAATRARDCLIVTAYHKERSAHGQRHAEVKCSLAECIHAACEELPQLRGEAPPAESALPLGLGTDDGTPPDVDARAEWMASRAELIARNSLPETVAVTAIAHAGEAPPDKPEPVGDEHAPWRRGRAGTAVGRAVHAVLQTIDHGTLEGLTDAARAQAAAEGVPDRAVEIATLVRTACASQPLRDALASGRSWRELYVATPILTAGGEVLVEGFVDLLYRADDGYAVVDYKTDAVRTEAEIDRAMERYRLQGAAYALALGSRLDAPVTRFECVFVTPARVRRVAGEALQAAIEEARGRVAVLRSGFDPTAASSAER
jgi:ATP-dependent exoDNAse (exonuclease V) beta subunit